MKTTLRVLALLFFASSLALVAASPTGAATRTLTVTPDSGLVDSQVVALAGTGFTPNSTIYFCQGVDTGAPGPNDCGSISTAPSNGSGEFSANYTVHRFVTTANSGEVDCASASPHCVMGASDYFDSGARSSRRRSRSRPNLPRRSTSAGR